MMDSGIRSDKINASKVFEKSMSACQLKKQYNLGDITWIKNRDNSWWPAQVVEENIVSGKGKRIKDEIPVRLYGSCDYLYVDPSRFSSEFENYIKQENISSKEVIQKALEKFILSQDLDCISGGNSKRKVSESKEMSSTKTPEGKLQKQEMMWKCQQTDNSPMPGPSSTNQDEERGKQQEKVADAGAEQDEATKSMAVTKLLDEPDASSIKVNITAKKKNVKSGLKVNDTRNLRRSQRTPVKELSLENDKAEQSDLKLQNHSEKATNSSKQLNAREMKQEAKKYTQRKATAEQMRRTDEEIKRMVILELAKLRQEQTSMRGVLLEADKDNPKGKYVNASPNQKIGSPELTKDHTPEDSARKIKVMQKLGLMAPSGSPFSRKRKL